MIESTVITAFLVAMVALVISAEMNADECWSIGFHRANLMCSSCDQLGDFNLDVLQDNCKQCCHPDENRNIVKRYPRAVLEVCTCKFGRYPQVEAFIKSDKPKKFPGLSIKYSRGTDPIIRLIDEAGEIQEVLAIDKWNTDTVEEFLKIHLQP
jgi:hypothetical protein